MRPFSLYARQRGKRKLCLQHFRAYSSKVLPQTSSEGLWFPWSCLPQPWLYPLVLIFSIDLFAEPCDKIPNRHNSDSTYFGSWIRRLGSLRWGEGAAWSSSICSNRKTQWCLHHTSREGRLEPKSGVAVQNPLIIYCHKLGVTSQRFHSLPK